METLKDGNRTIKAGQAITDFGYQWIFKQIDSQGFFENMIIQIKFTLNWYEGENFKFLEHFNFGIGSSW